MYVVHWLEVQLWWPLTIVWDCYRFLSLVIHNNDNNGGARVHVYDGHNHIDDLLRCHDQFGSASPFEVDELLHVMKQCDDRQIAHLVGTVAALCDRPRSNSSSSSNSMNCHTQTDYNDEYVT